eukprot:338720_1
MNDPFGDFYNGRGGGAFPASGNNMQNPSNQFGGNAGQNQPGQMGGGYGEGSPDPFGGNPGQNNAQQMGGGYGSNMQASADPFGQIGGANNASQMGGGYGMNSQAGHNQASQMGGGYGGMNQAVDNQASQMGGGYGGMNQASSDPFGGFAGESHNTQAGSGFANTTQELVPYDPFGDFAVKAQVAQPAATTKSSDSMDIFAQFTPEISTQKKTVVAKTNVRASQRMHQMGGSQQNLMATNQQMSNVQQMRNSQMRNTQQMGNAQQMGDPFGMTPQMNGAQNAQFNQMQGQFQEQPRHQGNGYGAQNQQQQPMSNALVRQVNPFDQAPSQQMGYAAQGGPPNDAFDMYSGGGPGNQVAIYDEGQSNNQAADLAGLDSFLDGLSFDAAPKKKGGKGKKKAPPSQLQRQESTRAWAAFDDLAQDSVKNKKGKSNSFDVETSESEDDEKYSTDESSDESSSESSDESDSDNYTTDSEQPGVQKETRKETPVATAKPADVPAANAEGWACPACTFMNALSKFTCDICTTKRPEATAVDKSQPAAPKVSEDEAAKMKFDQLTIAKDYAAALDLMNSGLHKWQSDNNVAMLWRLGLALLNSSKDNPQDPKHQKSLLESAEGILKMARRTAPNHVQVLKYMAMVLLNVHQVTSGTKIAKPKLLIATARRFAETARLSLPDDPELHLTMGILLFVQAGGRSNPLNQKIFKKSFARKFKNPKGFSAALDHLKKAHNIRATVTSAFFIAKCFEYWNSPVNARPWYVAATSCVPLNRSEKLLADKSAANVRKIDRN